MDELILRLANYYLEGNLRELKAEGNKTRTGLAALEGAAKGMQEVLYAAIETFPTQVNAVMVCAVVDPKREPNVGWDTRVTRQTLRDYIRLTSGSEELPDSLEMRLVKHLPFSLTGEKYRRTTYDFCQSVQIVVGVNFGRGPPEPYVAVDLKDRIFMDTAIYLFADEVTDVRLVKASDEEFSPLMDSYDRRLQPASSSAAHYLRYRGFKKWRVSAEDLPKDERSRSRIDAIASSVLVPDRQTGLLRVDYLSFETFTGFAACEEPESPSGAVLYEFNDVRLPKGVRGYGPVGIAHAIAMFKAGKQEGITVYVGDAIVEKLSGISPFRTS